MAERNRVGQEGKWWRSEWQLKRKMMTSSGGMPENEGKGWGNTGVISQRLRGLGREGWAWAEMRISTYLTRSFLTNERTDKASLVSRGRD